MVPVSSAEEVLALVEAGGAHVPALMTRLEERLEELATSHGRAARRRTPARRSRAGGKRLRPLLVFLSAGERVEPNHDGVLRAAVAVELIHSATLVHDDVLDAAPLRRGRPTVVATAGRAIATATGDLLFSRAFAELAGNGRPDEIRVLSDASLGAWRRASCSSARTPGTSRSRASATCSAATSRPRACSRPRAGSARSRAAGDADALGEFGRRIGLAFQLLDDVLDVSGPGRADRQAPRHRPARRHGHAAVHPRPRARSRAGDARPARRAHARGGRGACATRSRRPACWRRRATEALEMVAEAKADLPELPEPQRAALELVADSVADRYA